MLMSEISEKIKTVKKETENKKEADEKIKAIIEAAIAERHPFPENLRTES